VPGPEGLLELARPDLVEPDRGDKRGVRPNTSLISRYTLGGLIGTSSKSSRRSSVLRSSLTRSVQVPGCAVRLLCLA